MSDVEQLKRRAGRTRQGRWAVLDSPLVLRLCAFAIFAILWQIYAIRSSSLFVPTFTDTMRAIGGQLVDIEVWSAFASSHPPMLIGFAVGSVTGIVTGLLITRYDIAYKLSWPFLYALLATPLVGLVPLLTMSVGLGLLSRSLLVWSFVYPFVVETTAAGVRQVDRGLIEMVRVYGGSESDVWRRVLLPGSLDAIKSGLRIGLGRAIEAMVIVELIMVAVGIGGLMLKYQATFAPPQLYGTVFLVVAEALILLHVFDVTIGRLRVSRARARES